MTTGYGGFEASFESWQKSGRGFSELSDALAAAVDTLVADLVAAGACWGEDDIGHGFFNGGEGSQGFGAVRDACLAGLADSVNLVRATGGVLKVAGRRYAIADEASTIGKDLPLGADHDAEADKDPYHLPAHDFNRPVGDIDQLPEIVRKGLFFLEMLVGGCQWPDGSMDNLAKMQAAFTTCANEVSTVAAALDGHTGTVVSANAGEAVEKFKTFAEALTGGGEAGGLRFLELSLRQLASSTGTFQAQKRAARLQFEISCAFVVVTMAMGLAFSAFTAGASEGAAVAASEAEGFALRAFLQRIAAWSAQHQVLSAAMVGAWFGAGMDASRQYAQIHEGVQKGWNWGEFSKSVAMGAVAGGVMGVAGRAVARQSNPLTTKLADWMATPGVKGVAARFGFAGTSGTAGNLASQVIFDPEHINVGQAAAFGFGMAGLGGAKELGQHVGSQFRSGRQGGATNGTGAPTGEGEAVNGNGSPTGEGRDTSTGGGTAPPAGGTHTTTGSGGANGTELAAAGSHESPASGGDPGHVPESPVTGGQGRPVAGGHDGTTSGDTGGTGGPERGPAIVNQPDPTALPARPGEVGQGGTGKSIAELLNGKSQAEARPGATSGHPEGSTGNGPRPGEAGPRPGGDATGPKPSETGSGSGTRPGEGSTGARPGDPAATAARTSPSPTPDQTRMARTAMTDAQRVVAPDGLLLRDGSVRVTGADGRSVTLPYDHMRETQDRLAARAAEGATGESLHAEAARWLGEEIARSTGGHPAEGGLEALHRLAENSPEMRPAATALAHETLSAHPDRADLAANWPPRATKPEPNSLMRPGMHESAARDIAHQAEELAAALSTPVVPDPGTSQPPRTGSGGRVPGAVESAPDAARSTVPAPVRQAHMEDLTLGEIGSASADLQPHLGRGVDGVEWNPDTATLRVRTEAGAVHEFHVSVRHTDGPMAETRVGADGRTHEVTFAPWVMSKEAAEAARRSPEQVAEAAEAAGLSPEQVAEAVEAARLSPEQVAEAADQLPRTWLREITDTLQRVSATEARSGQGMIRRFLDAVGPGRHGDRAASGYNEHRYLADKWLHATDSAERAHYVREISGLARRMRAEGHTPAAMPWISGADGARPAPAERAAAPVAPEAARLAELTDQVVRVRESLRNDITALEERVAEHQRRTDEAGKALESAYKVIARAATDRDHAAATRAGDAVSDGQAALDRQFRHRQLAETYQKALQEARSASVTYEAARRSLDQLADELHGPTAREAADAAAMFTRRGADELASYGRAMHQTAPPDAAIASGKIFGPLAHLRELTRTTNEAVAAAGSKSTFAPDTLNKTLRAGTSDLLSESGVLVPLDKPGAFVRIQAEFTDLVEVTPVMTPAEAMGGGFAEGGHGHGATAAHSETVAISADASKLATLIPDHVNSFVDGVKAALTLFGPNVEVDVGRGRSISGSGMQDARPGAVVDIRNGEVRVLDGRVTYKVSVIPGHDVPETLPTHVAEGKGNDAATTQLLVSNSFTGRDLPHSVQLPLGEGTGKMPHVADVELTGLDKWHADVVESITRQGGELDPVVREQLRTILTQESKKYLQPMVNKPNGELRTIPGADLGLRMKAKLDLSKFTAMHSSKVDWLEKVDVGTLGTSGNESFNVSKKVAGSIPLPIDRLWGGPKDVIPGSGEFNVGFGGKLNGDLGVTRSETANVGGTSVPVFVERFVGRTQAELIEPGGVVFEAELYSLSDGRLLGTVSADVGGSIRLSAKGAAEAGMPVDVAAVKVDESGAIIRNPDGTVATPEDHGPVAPSERKDRPPHIGNGPEQLRGAGFGLVRNITGIGEAAGRAMPKLRELDLLSELDGNGMPKSPTKHPDQLEFLQRLATQRKLEDFPERFFDAHYDQLCQTGMRFELADGHSLTVRLNQRFDEFADLGPDGSRNLVGLNIDSQSSSAGVSESKAWSAGGGLSVPGKNSAPHKAGWEAKLEGGGGINHAHSTGRNETVFENHVGLKELKQLRRFEAPHEAIVEIWKGDTLVGQFTEHGKAEISWPSEILPDAHSRPAEVARLRSEEGKQPTPEKLVRNAYVEHIDAGRLVDSLRLAVPDGVLSVDRAEAFLNSASLRGAKVKLLGDGYETGIDVDPHGPQPRSYTIKVEMDGLGPSKITDVHDSVTGDINLTVEGTTTSSSETKSRNATGSVGGGYDRASGSSTGGGLDGSRSRSTTTARSDNTQTGLERLDIQVGKDVAVHTAGHMKITVTDQHTGESWSASGDVPMRLAAREPDVLQMHLDNEYHLPLDRMSDVVERLHNGSLELDPNLAVRVVGRYAEDLASAVHSGAEKLPPLARDHTPEVLGDVLEKVTGVGHKLTETPEEHRLNEVATHAKDLELAPQEVALYEPYEKAMAMSLFDDVVFDRPPHEALLEAVEQRAPGVLDQDPTLRQRLSAQHEGERWEGISDNMFDPWGARKDLRVLTDPDGRTQVLVVRAKAEWNGRPVMHGKVPGKVPIFQSYTYKGHSESRTGGRSLGGDVNASHGWANGGSVNGSVGTTRSRSVTTSVAHEEIRLKRLMWLDGDGPAASKGVNETGKRSLLDDKKGMALIRHPLKITYTVDLVTLEPGQVKLPDAELLAPVPVEVNAVVGRTLPARMARPAGEPVAPEGEHVPDHRPLTIGNDFAVDLVEPEGPYQAMRDNFVDLLGKGSEWEVERRLQHEWSALQRQGRVEQMMGQGGYPIHVEVGGHEVEAVVRMELSDARISHTGAAEISEVNRREDQESWSVSRSELLPPSRSVGGGGALGFGIKHSSGAQASRSISDAGGGRQEHSAFATTDVAHSGEFTAKYTFTFSRDGKFVFEAGMHDTVHLTVAGHELATAHARQEAGPPPELPDGGAPAVTPGPRAGADWTPVGVDPAQPSAPLRAALIKARLDNAEVRIEVPGGPDGARRYTALPDGTLRSDDPPLIDGGFAKEFGRLHPLLPMTADEHQIDLRTVFNRPGEGTFSDKIRAELTEQGIPIPEDAAEPVVPMPKAGGPKDPGHGGVTGEGSAGGGASSAGGGM